MSAIEKSADNSALESALALVAEAAKSIRYGSVEVLIHEGRIVQIETREKIRVEQRK